jgi:hypothetical protein
MITYSYLYITGRGKEDMEYIFHILSEFHKLQDAPSQSTSLLTCYKRKHLT